MIKINSLINIIINITVRSDLFLLIFLVIDEGTNIIFLSPLFFSHCYQLATCISASTSVAICSGTFDPVEPRRSSFPIASGEIIAYD